MVLGFGPFGNCILGYIGGYTGLYIAMKNADNIKVWWTGVPVDENLRARVVPNDYYEQKRREEEGYDPYAYDEGGIIGF